MAEKKTPVRKYRIGTVALAVWENKAEGGNTFNSYTPTFSYYDEKAKAYKDTKSVTKIQLYHLRDIIDKCIADEVTIAKDE